MGVIAVPPVLVERLGQPASLALLQMMNEHNQSIRDDLAALCAERFERRLVEETSRVRVELAVMGAGLREEMATSRVEILKWAFVFWVGQLATVVGIIAFMLRGVAGR